VFTRAHHWYLGIAAMVLLLPAAARGQEPETKKEETPPAAPREASVVQLRLRGSFAEGVPEENPFGPGRLHFRGLLELVRKAANDPKVQAIILRTESPALGLAQVRELLGALAEFRAAQKRIYAYAEEAGTMDLLLLSTANRLEMSDAAMAFLPGVSAQSLYMKGLFDRLGIRFLVAHIGAYKSAFESYSRDEMSKELREVLTGLVDAQHDAICEILARNRGIDRERVAAAIDHAVLSAADLHEHGLIDEIADHDHFLGDVKADLGVDRIKVLKSYGRKSVELDAQNPFAVFRLIMEAFSPPQKRASSSPKIAIVYASGPILSGKSQASPFGGATCGSETLVEALRKAADDETVRAIVLRIDSPGGSGTASDAIWRAVVAAKARKPVVASMSDVAASGGYYIAMGASRILAQPETITGSIGVVSALLNVRGALDRLGIRVETVARGRNAGLFSPFAAPDEASLEPLRRVMEGFYWQFVDKAAAGRGKTREALHAVAQGRVWTGADALGHGLVDELGGLRRAIEVARELAGVPAGEKLETIELPGPPNFLEAISEALGMTAASAAAAGSLAASLAPGERQALEAVPELRRLVARAQQLLEMARGGAVLLCPVEIEVR
jgi:protease-4